MDIWDTRSLDLQPRHPQVLHSADAARVIAIALAAGESLDEHQVHEHAYLMVADGQVELAEAGQSEPAGPGTLAHWMPNERHEVRAVTDARLILILAPWPGPGHPNHRAEGTA